MFQANSFPVFARDRRTATVPVRYSRYRTTFCILSSGLPYATFYGFLHPAYQVGPDAIHHLIRNSVVVRRFLSQIHLVVDRVDDQELALEGGAEALPQQ